MNWNAAAAGLRVVLQDVGAGDVRRHQVGRELNAAKRQLQDPGDRADQQRLRQPRHADQQAVPAAEQGDQQLLDDIVLPDDDLADLLAHARVRGGEAADGLGLLLADGFGGEIRIEGHGVLE